MVGRDVSIERNFLGQLFVQGVTKKTAKKFLSIDASRPVQSETLSNLKHQSRIRDVTNMSHISVGEGLRSKPIWSGVYSFSHGGKSCLGFHQDGAAGLLWGCPGNFQ